MAEPKGDDFMMTVGGKTYAERREAGLELIRMARLMNEKARSAGKEIQKEVGSYAGLQLALHASGFWDNHFAEIYARGTHYSYGADVRSDSDPVGLIRSLHHSVYKGMESKLASVQRMLESKEATRPHLEKMTATRFAKAAELEEKEARYKAVVEAIQASSKEGDRAVETCFDWTALEGWASEKVGEEVARYLEGSHTSVVARETEESSPSLGGVEQKIKQLYALQLPKTLLEVVTDGLHHGRLTTEGVMQVLGRVIRDFDSTGPTWVEGNGDGLSGSFRRNREGVSPGDLLIRKETDYERPTYKVYLVTRGGKERYLGSDGSIAAVKVRARQFYVFSGVAARLRGANGQGIAATGLHLASERENSRKAGLAYEL